MFKFLAGIIFALLLIPVFVFSYVKMGYVPVATDSPDMPFERQLAHMSLDAKIDKEAPKPSPFQATKDDFLSAAHLYREHCAMCHGLPNEPKTFTAQGMYPRPPQLLKGKGVTDDPAWRILLENRQRYSFKRHARLQKDSVGKGDVADQSVGRRRRQASQRSDGRS